MAILIVEDNPTNGLILRHLMAKAGSGEIVVCHDPAKALQICKTQSFDLLMVDHMLPGMTGVQFVRLIRSFDDFRDTPIVMVTADTSAEVREEALAAGVNTFLTKPIEALGFTRMMSRLIVTNAPTAAQKTA
ncbi:response regulator [Rhizobium sp. C4]|uniref:response regulator n=1 Tax=Rhizobium sp. C4 TaxID=1349800 RepID=UPI001E5F3699|nr:response regulator [Rhizobium sp. C4]MCD2174483.1 response regulator [Rhizobium sp. C4]